MGCKDLGSRLCWSGWHSQVALLFAPHLYVNKLLHLTSKHVKVPGPAKDRDKGWMLTGGGGGIYGTLETPTCAEEL